MAELEPWKQDVEFVSDVIRGWRMGPFDETPLRRLDVGPIGHRMLAAYEHALEGFTSNYREGLDGDYSGGAITATLTQLVGRDVAVRVYGRAQLDARELRDVDVIVASWTPSAGS